MNKVWLWLARALALGLVVFGLYIFNSNAPHAHADDTQTCYENGQVETYYVPRYCPNQFGPDYGHGNHRWPDGSDD